MKQTETFDGLVEDWERIGWEYPNHLSGRLRDGRDFTFLYADGTATLEINGSGSVSRRRSEDPKDVLNFDQVQEEFATLYRIAFSSVPSAPKSPASAQSNKGDCAFVVMYLVLAMNLVANSLEAWNEEIYLLWAIMYGSAMWLTYMAVNAIRRFK